MNTTKSEENSEQDEEGERDQEDHEQPTKSPLCKEFSLLLQAASAVGWRLRRRLGGRVGLWPTLNPNRVTCVLRIEIHGGVVRGICPESPLDADEGCRHPSGSD